jgi:hypothetical protein
MKRSSQRWFWGASLAIPAAAALASVNASTQRIPGNISFVPPQHRQNSR